MGIMIVGVIVIGPFFLFEAVRGAELHFNHGTFFTISYVAVFASVLAFLFWNRAVREIGANKAGPFIHLMPVFSTLLAVLFLGEKMYGYHYGGVAFILLGILMATVRSNPSTVSNVQRRKSR